MSVFNNQLTKFLAVEQSNSLETFALFMIPLGQRSEEAPVSVFTSPIARGDGRGNDLFGGSQTPKHRHRERLDLELAEDRRLRLRLPLESQGSCRSCPCGKDPKIRPRHTGLSHTEVAQSLHSVFLRSAFTFPPDHPKFQRGQKVELHSGSRARGAEGALQGQWVVRLYLETGLPVLFLSVWVRL